MTRKWMTGPAPNLPNARRAVPLAERAHAAYAAGRPLTGAEACIVAGITYRQLDYWARTDLIRPSIADARGSGTQRRYSAHDVFLLRLIKSLLDLGASLATARAVLPQLAAAETPPRWLAVRVNGGVSLAAAGDLEALVGAVLGGAIVVDLDALRAAEVPAA